MSTTVASRLPFLRETLAPVRPAVSALFRPFSAGRNPPSDAADAGAGGGDGSPNLFVVQPRLRPDHLLQAKLSEALNLASSLEEQRDDGLPPVEKKKPPPFSIVQNPLSRSRGHADTYFGPGTVENVKCQLEGITTELEDGPDAVFVNAVLSGVQQRNLERAWGRPVLDRIGLIIEIFNAHAQTKEAKLQSELAALMYKRTRLVRVRGPSGRLTFGVSGDAEVVSAKGKGTGGRGFLSGAGESEIQLQRRRIQERRDYLLHEIEEVRRTRALQRYARKRRGGSEGQGLATVAVVGYTNAGKSTLVSALSHNDLYSDDRLFATVDPRLRSVVLPSGRKVLLSDTVGFISELPVQLIEAFHATLEEVVDADLLVHVIDSCAKNLEEQRLAVLEVLKQIGVSEEKIQNMIEVWNKIDLVDSGPGDAISLEENIEVCNDDENSNSNKDEILLNRVPNDSFSELFEDEDESDQLLDEENEYLKNDNKDFESHKLHCSLKGGSVSRDFTEDSGIEHKEISDGLGYKLVSQLSEYKSAYGTASSIGSSFEGPAPSNSQEVKFVGGQEMGKLDTCLPEVVHIKTSAITGVGLQELLQAIDDKLTRQEVSRHRVEYIDRKWRPSSSYSS